MVIDSKSITLNNKDVQVRIVVYLKEVSVRNNKRAVKAFCRIE